MAWALYNRKITNLSDGRLMSDCFLMTVGRNVMSDGYKQSLDIRAYVRRLLDKPSDLALCLMTPNKLSDIRDFNLIAPSVAIPFLTSFHPMPLLTNAAPSLAGAASPPPAPTRPPPPRPYRRPPRAFASTARIFF